MDGMYLDFSRAFNIIVHLIHICKFRKYGLDKLPIRGLKNWLGRYAEGVVGSGLKAQLLAGNSTPEFRIVRYFYWQLG